LFLAQTISSIKKKFFPNNGRIITYNMKQYDGISWGNNLTGKIPGCFIGGRN
jgi:hypothetical protein